VWSGAVIGRHAARSSYTLLRELKTFGSGRASWTGTADVARPSRAASTAKG
jgi:hypothetical protein